LTEHTFLDEWANGLRIEHTAHRRACARAERLGRVLGIAVVVLTTAVGTAVFGSIEGAPGTGAKVTAGLITMTAAVLAALQTFLGLDARAAVHRETGTRYGSLRRELDELRGGAGVTDEALRTIRQRWDDVDATAPPVPPRVYEASRRSVLAGTSAR
jgi:hypothetical protein